MYLNTINDKTGSSKRKMRVGRGPGSGKGKTCGRGQKGQKSRSGSPVNGFEGGQMPIYRRLPKRGFNVLNPKNFSIINIGRLQKFISTGLIDPSKTIDDEVLQSVGLVRARRDGIRLLGAGKIESKVTIVVNHASVSAISAIEKMGGNVEIKTLSKPIKDNKLNKEVKEK